MPVLFDFRDLLCPKVCVDEKRHCAFTSVQGTQQHRMQSLAIPNITAQTQDNSFAFFSHFTIFDSDQRLLFWFIAYHIKFAFSMFLFATTLSCNWVVKNTAFPLIAASWTGHSC